MLEHTTLFHHHHHYQITIMTSGSLREKSSITIYGPRSPESEQLFCCLPFDPVTEEPEFGGQLIM